MRTPLILAAALLGVLAVVLVGRWLASAPPAAAAPPGPVVDQGRALAIPVQETLAVAPVEEVVPEPTRQLVQDDAPHSEVSSNAEFPSAILVHASDRDTGLPLAGVRILVWPVPDEKGFGIRHGETSSESFGTSPLTDAEGHARIAVAAGRAFRIATNSNGEHSQVTVQVEPLEVGEERVVELLLSSASHLHFFGRVVDDADGEPILDARVCLGSVEEVVDAVAPPSDGTRIESTRSSGPHDGRTWIGVDASGVFEVDVKFWQSIRARVEAPGYAWIPLNLSAGHESRERAREVRLRRAAVVDASVVSGGGFPIEGASVRLSAKLYDLNSLGGMTEMVFSSSPVTWNGSTDAHGRCRIEGLPASVPLTLEARSPDGRSRQSIDLSLAQGEVREVELRLGGGGAALRGRVRDASGVGVAHAELWLVPRDGEIAACLKSYGMDAVATRASDADGRFRFEDVADGSWLVGLSPKGRYAPQAEVVVVANGLPDREPDLLAVGDLYLRGHLLDPDDRPVQGYIFAVARESGCFASANCRKDGSFELGPLVPGEYTASVASAGFGTGESWVGGEPVTAQAGTEGLVLRVLRGGSVSGRVLDAAGQGGVRADVVIAGVDPSQANQSLSMGSSTDDGSFSFEGLKPGTYAVSASTSTTHVARSGLLTVVVGGEVRDVQLRLEPGARLRVRYAGTQPYGQIRVRQEGRCVFADGLQRGSDTLLVVPAGELTVECAEHVGRTPSVRTKSVTVAVGELADVEFPGAED